MPGLRNRAAPAARALLLVLAFVIVGSGVFLVASEFPTATHPPSVVAFTPLTVRDETATASGGEIAQGVAAISVCPDSRPIVSVVVRSYDHSAETTTLKASICVPKAFVSELVSSPGRIPLYREIRSGTSEGCVEVPSGSAPPSMVLDWQPIAEGEAHRTTVTLPRGVCQDGEPVDVPGNIVLPVRSTPQRYPFDTYSAGVILEFASGPGVRSRHQGDFAEGRELIFEGVSVYTAQGLMPFALSATGTGFIGPNQTQAPGVLFELHRPVRVKLYVMLIVAIPLVLEALLVIVLFRRREEEGRRLGPEVLAGVAAVLLAILPIRQVLVPSSISVLTFVDYMLGLEMAILAAIACVVVWHSLRERPS